jgi:hypothetical protein
MEGRWQAEAAAPTPEEPTVTTLFFALILELVVGRLIANHNQTRLDG